MKHCAYRNNIIKSYCANRNVLDIGSTGQTDRYSLWAEIKKVASSLQGIDITPNHDPCVVLGNMETHQFNNEFDIIVAGDIIEHTINQGIFLKNIRKHLADNGKLIITTPNAKWPTVFLKPNPTHTLWHDRYTLAYLLTQHGFIVESAGYYLGNKPHYPFFVRPFIWRQGMIFICKKSKTSV